MTSPTTVVTGLRANWGVSNCGQLMGTDKEAGLASIEPEGWRASTSIWLLAYWKRGIRWSTRRPPAAPIMSSTTYMNPAAELYASTVTSVGTIIASL